MDKKVLSDIEIPSLMLCSICINATAVAYIEIVDVFVA